MATNEAVNAEAEEREDFVWTNQGPGTKLTGTFEGLIYAGRLSPSEAQNGSSFGVVFTDVEVDEGTLYVNDAKPEEGFTVVDEDSGKRATDYRLMDPDDEKTTMLGDTGMISDRSGATYSPGEVAESTVIVWYNGLSGQRVGRTLDFHGIPFAEYKEDGYLNKGLFQVCADWRNGNRAELSRNGLAPRVARVPLAREGLLGERISVEMERKGRAHYVHITDAEGEEVEMQYSDAADARLQEEGIEMLLHHGEGWQDRPANAEGPAPSFNIEVPTGDDNEYGLTPVADAFATDVASALEGTGHTPETAFEAAGGIAGLMEQHGVEADVEAVRAAIYDRVSHLDSLSDDE